MRKIAALTILYGLIFSVSEWLSECLNHCHVLTVAAIPIYLLLVTRNICGKGCAEGYGICTGKRINALLLVPMLVLPLVNLLLCRDFCGEQLISISFTEILLIIIHTFAEEMLFRGVLPVKLKELILGSSAMCMTVANVTFALVHFVNTSACFAVIPIWLQIIVAFGCGIFLSGLREITGGILPGFVVHALFNLSSGFPYCVLPFQKQLIYLFISVLYCILGFYLYSHKSRRTYQ